MTTVVAEKTAAKTGLIAEFATLADSADKAQTKALIACGAVARKYIAERVGKEEDKGVKRSLRSSAVKSLSSAADWSDSEVSRACALSAAADRWPAIAGLSIRKAVVLCRLLERGDGAEYTLVDCVESEEAVVELIGAAGTSTREELAKAVDRLLGKEEAEEAAEDEDEDEEAAAEEAEGEDEGEGEGEEAAAEISSAADAALEIARLAEQFPGALNAAAPLLPLAAIIGLVEGLAEAVRQNRDTNSQAAFGKFYKAAQEELTALRAEGVMPQKTKTAAA